MALHVRTLLLVKVACSGARYILKLLYAADKGCFEWGSKIGESNNVTKNSVNQ